MRKSTSTRRKVFFSIVALGLGGLLLELLSMLALSMIAQQPDVVQSETHLFDAHRNHRLNPRFQLSADERDKIHSNDSLRSS